MPPKSKLLRVEVMWTVTHATKVGVTKSAYTFPRECRGQGEMIVAAWKKAGHKVITSEVDEK